MEARIPLCILAVVWEVVVVTWEAAVLVLIIEGIRHCTMRLLSRCFASRISLAVEERVKII